MRSNYLKGTLKTAVLAVTILLFGVGVSFGQATVSLTAAPGQVTLPDGTVVQMWGYNCISVGTSGESCAALDKAPKPVTTWSPVVITVPYVSTGTSLTITLTNSLPAPVPTSLVIVGQLGGGLGTPGNFTAPPDHTNAQPVTWPIANTPPGAAPVGVGTPPDQGPRVQSFGTEVANGATNAGLTWSNLKPGTYLIESGTHPSIQGPMGLYGILVVTTAPTSTSTTGTAYPAAGAIPAVTYNAEVPLLFSEIDPVQNNAVYTAVNTPGFKEDMVWSGQPGGCGYPTSATYHQCYPPAVNYTPLYYMINGVAFDKTNSPASLFPVSTGTSTTTPVTGNVLIRMVNAGLRMHVPSIVGTVTGGSSASGFGLIAEDGNPLPGITRVQSEVFMPAGKTYDVVINAPATVGTALPVFDRQLSLSANSTARDAGMLAYIGINGAVLPASGAFAATGVTANPDAYPSLIPCTAVPCQPITVSDPGKGVIANDVNIYGVQVSVAPTGGTLTAFNANGTFTYVPNVGTTSDSFMYCGNGSTAVTACTTVTLGAATVEGGGSITCAVPTPTYSSNVATALSIKPPGILSFCKDAAGYPLKVNAASVTPGTGLTLSVDSNGGFNASVGGAGTYTFTFLPQNSQGTVSTNTASTVTLVFPTPSNLAVTVLDGKDRTTVIGDYRWVIEEDRTFYIDPNCTTNPPAAGCPTSASGIVPTFGTNFHTSYMPVVATGCTGTLSCESGQTMVDSTGNHIKAVCDVGAGVCRPDAAGNGEAQLLPGQVHLDPTKRYYISVLPGDAGNPFHTGNLSADCTNGSAQASDPGACGHGMGGAPIATFTTCATPPCTPTPVTILSEPDPYPPAKLSVFVFEDDFPLNGEQDGGGGIDVLSPNEPGLGGFNITLFDDAGGSGDATGQMTYDMFNQPLVNGLSGTLDPATGVDACPVSANSRPTIPNPSDPTKMIPDPSQTGITGTIVTCPKYEADGVTLSPLSGQAVVPNLMPGRYGVVATPAADRIARGEEWLQTNTLDGQKAHDSFLRIGEPSFFQEFGPAGYHVSIGFANPAIINNRRVAICNGTDPNISGSNCTHTVTGRVTTERMSRAPDERLYSSGDNSSFAFTQCYVSFGDPDGEDFIFTKCAADGTFTLSNVPSGDWRVTVFDQWNDMLVDGLSTPVRVGNGTTNLGDIAMNQWQANIYTSTFFDQNGDGVHQDSEPGLTLVATNIRFRDGSYSNFNNTDLGGNAGFNEVFPLFSWYVVETDATRYKNTGVHVVYDAGGPADGAPGCGGTGNSPCAPSPHTISSMMANSYEALPVPGSLHVPGAHYCTNADCSDAAGHKIAPNTGSTPNTTSRIDPAWVVSEGWQGFSGQNSFLEFGKAPFVAGENGGIRGEVIYASTRPFDDPSLLIHTSWTPDVPGVTINLYKEGTAPDGTVSLTLVDTTKTSSWDDWAQGFRSDGVPNMNCPGQGKNTGTNADLFFFSLFNQPMWLDEYNNVLHGTSTTTTALPNNSQFKCYDGMHNWNQLQPAPYDGMYSFPSVTSIDPATGKPTGTNCTACMTNPDNNDAYRYGGSTTSVAWTPGHGAPMLPVGKYVVEMITPPGYELVKEEDKNILIGDNYIAPATVEFPGLGGAIYILPDQAEISSFYNSTNQQNPTQTLGRTTYPSSEGDTGSVEVFWPCVGAQRTVPDYISLFPQSLEVAPFAGAVRNLCDRKEITLTDQTTALAKFWIFTSAHVAAHFTGVITDDFTSEFDPFSPQFGEKFSPPNMPISIKDWTGTEISRVYADHWGTYDGLTYSTWEVNPPNPTGYAPTMMVTCMNDPGPIPDPSNPGQMKTDPLYNPQYSQFCYEIPFMPGQTQYMDTPVVPTSAFAGAGYNNPDCAYPAATPAIKEVDGDGVGPWVGAAAGQIASLTLNSAGNNYTSAPFNFSIPPAADGGTGRVTDLTLVSIAPFTCTTGTTGNNRCSLFSATPTVILFGGGGSGTVVTATKSGTTISFTVVNGGGGYTSRPLVFIAHTAGFPSTVSPTSVHMGVNGITVTAPGSGYPGTSIAVTIVGGGGTNATATATVGTSSQTLTITALGDVPVPNNAYSGPSASTAPYNQKTVMRHYGFGSTGTVALVGSDMVVRPLTGVIWGDTSITGTVPAGLPNCALQQQAQYGGSPARCGQLVITNGDNGKQSIDTVTVTVGGKAPTHVGPASSIQDAIDAAKPGDMIIVDATFAPSATAPVGTDCSTATKATATCVPSQVAHNELLLMWKPVRLQGVGAASSVINANTHPAGKLDTWRLKVNCLFGLGVNGSPNTWDPGCGSGWYGFNATPNAPQVDRLPLEAAVGWDATQNGNMAELLQEPSLMGALEGAGITVLSKGLDFHGQSPWTDATETGGFPAGTQLLQNVVGFPPSTDHCRDNPNPFPSNFECNPSSIDGLGITDSSQGGGGVFVHGWSHNLQVANDRINSNSGTLSGGISVGQGEFPGAYIFGSGTNAAPDSCQQTGFVLNQQQPYCFDVNVNLHNNAITSNSSTGDELFSATPAGAGGVTICNGSDNYRFNNNWVCGNLSTGDGGGFAHIGYSHNGDIEHNAFLFNQSTNPTIATNGGGVLIMGAPDVDPTCGATTDQDCLPAPGSIGPSDGTGPGLVINANLIMGNSADSGSGGGLRLQGVNGTDVITFPTTPARWYSVAVTNNIITNNVAGWDGAGISLLDALNVNIINNTVMSNDTTASSGMLFQTLGAPVASSGGTNCHTGGSGVGAASCPQPAGLVSVQNSAVLTANLPNSLQVVCPAGHYTTTSATNGNCKRFSIPLLENDIFWQNRAFYIGVGSLGAGTLNQQRVVTLYNAFGPQTAANRAASQTITGACDTPASFWDIGVRGDTAVNSAAAGNPRLAPMWSVLSSGNYTSNNNSTANPTVISQYCNGSRVPPELKTMGYQVPPGIADATVPNPVFSLTPAATVDEGNNWINLSWGPLALTNAVTGATLGNYALASNSPAIDHIPCTVSTAPCQATGEVVAAPTTDYFGHPRPDSTTNAAADVGAVETQADFTSASPTLTSIAPASGAQGATVSVVLTGTNLITATAVNAGAGITATITSINSNSVTANLVISATATLGARNVTVITTIGTTNAVTFTVTQATLTSITPNTGGRGSSVDVTLVGTNLTGATGLAISGTGVTVAAGSFTVVNDTTITATLNITSTATLSARTIGVALGAVTTNTVTFTVTGPTLTSIAPNAGVRGTAVPVTLTGTSLSGATSVTVSGTGVTVSNFTVVNPTTVTATFTIAANATLSVRNVAVVTPIGTTNTVTFTVQGATLASIAPNTGSRSAAVPVTLTGANLTGATSVTVSGTGVTVSNFTVVNPTTVTATFTISATATLSARNVAVVTPIGTTNNVSFTVGP